MRLIISLLIAFIGGASFGYLLASLMFACKKDDDVTIICKKGGEE